MWMRSSVERLTGMSKRSIQELCSQSRHSDGVAFWHPAESRPGYSRFDRLDMLAFYLVSRFRAAGFTLAEMSDIVPSAFCADGSCAQLLEDKVERLTKKRDELDGAIACARALRSHLSNDIRDGGGTKPLERIVRGCIIDAAARAYEDLANEEGASASVSEFRAELERMLESPSAIDNAKSSEGQKGGKVGCLRQLAQLMEGGVPPDSDEAQGVVAEALGTIGDAEASPIALRAALRLLDEEGFGALIEIVYGEGSYEYAHCALRAREEREQVVDDDV